MLSRGFALSSEAAINFARMFAYVVGAVELTPPNHSAKKAQVTDTS